MTGLWRGRTAVARGGRREAVLTSPYGTHDHLWSALLVIALLGGLGVLMLLGEDRRVQPHEQFGRRPEKPPPDRQWVVLVGIIATLVGVILIQVARRSV